MDWVNEPGHIIFLLSLCICIIIGEGIIIFALLRTKKYDYGTSDSAQKIAAFRAFWGSFVVYVIATSIIALFIASFISKQNVSLNDMNTWVSLILGMVALIIGIISLFLSFYNVEQSMDVQKDSKNDIMKMQENFREEMRSLQNHMESIMNDIAGQAADQAVEKASDRYNIDTKQIYRNVTKPTPKIESNKKWGNNNGK